MLAQTSDNNKRIAENSLLLYFRIMFLMVFLPQRISPIRVISLDLL